MRIDGTPDNGHHLWRSQEADDLLQLINVLCRYTGVSGVVIRP